MSPGSTALPPPQRSARLTLLADIFAIWPHFLPFPPLWSLVPGFLSGGFFRSRDSWSTTGPISGSWPWAWATSHSWATTHSLLPSLVYHCAACWWLLAPYLWCCRRNTEGAFSMIAPQDKLSALLFCFQGWCWISQWAFTEGIPANMLPVLEAL